MASHAITVPTAPGAVVLMNVRITLTSDEGNAFFQIGVMFDKIPNCPAARKAQTLACSAGENSPALHKSIDREQIGHFGHGSTGK